MRPPDRDAARTLLVLYPYMEAFPGPEIASGLALPAIRFVLADEPSTLYEQEYFDEIIELPPPERISQALDILRRWCDRHRPEGIFLQSEVALPLGSLLAGELGLPGPSVQAVHLCTNKYLSRLVLARAGVSVPCFCLAERASQVRSFARKYGYPVLLKGVCSAMSRLVTLIRREEEVEPAVAQIRSRLIGSTDLQRLVAFIRAAGLEAGCDPLRQFLVETFVGGVPIETDGFVVGETPYPFSIIEQVLSRNPPFFFEGYLLPAESPGVDREETLRVSAATLRAVGLQDSGFAIEMRAREGKVWVIEVNGRLGLDDGFAEMFALGTAAQPTREAVRLALGKRGPITVEEHRRAALAYRCCYRDAVVQRLPAADKLQQSGRDGLRIGLAAEVGRRFFSPPHPEAYPHLAWALAAHETSSRAAYKAAREAVGALDFVLRSV